MVIHRIKSIKAEKLALASFGVLFSITLLSGAILVNTRANADDTTQSDNVTVTVSSACTLSRSAGSGTYSASLNPGQETGDISGSTIKAICNDGNGYSLYAIGYSGDSYTGNNTKMIGTYGNIDTGTSGDNSWWAMKLAPVAGTYAPDIVNSFDNYHVVPATFTQVAKLTSATDAGESANGSSVDAFYKVKASTSQVAGTYTGKVKYVLVHPNTATPGTYTIAYNANGGSGTMESSTGIYTFDAFELPESTFTAPSGYAFAGWCTTQDTSQNPQTTCGGTSYDAGDEVIGLASAGQTIILYAYWKVKPLSLYEEIAAMTKGVQTASDLQATIIVPDETTTISTNSGVYTYNDSVFGTSSDASNDYPIYYYRGILDSYGNVGEYGSDGLSDAYPNYVKLSNNTCWRIIRTTGSGGIKMIYNGAWDSVNNTCANIQTNARVASNTWLNGVYSITSVGYTYNPSYNTTQSSTYASWIFGIDGCTSDETCRNTTDSDVKDYIEDSWYTNNMSAYTSILEPSAGYCNDRSRYSRSGNAFYIVNDSAKINYPYKGSASTATEYYFGASLRSTYSSSSGKLTSLTCPRGAVDLYTTNSAATGNKQLSYPVGLVTGDEAIFAGFESSPRVGNKEPHNYLNSGSTFWTMSPYYRDATGSAFIITTLQNGQSSYDRVYYNRDVRPVISLVADTTPVSGSGTATNPWVVGSP